MHNARVLRYLTNSIGEIVDHFPVGKSYSIHSAVEVLSKPAEHQPKFSETKTQWM